MAGTLQLIYRRLGSMHGEQQETNRRLGSVEMEARITNERLTSLEANSAAHGARMVESEIRTATALASVAGEVRNVTALLREQLDLRPRIEKCEQDIVELKERL